MNRSPYVTNNNIIEAQTNSDTHKTEARATPSAVAGVGIAAAEFTFHQVERSQVERGREEEKSAVVETQHFYDILR